MNKTRIAIVVQRYGREVNGGAELYAKLVTERLSALYDVEVLTTCAIDYVSWRNEYEQGQDTVDGVKVRRFRVDRQRDNDVFTRLSGEVYAKRKDTIEDGIQWMEAQGPFSPELIQYIRENKDEYDLFLFMTYLYYTSYFGLQEVPEKSILIPTAHDERPIYLNIFNSSFRLPRALVYLTEEEKAFVNKKFKNSSKPSEVVGIGIDMPDKVYPDRFREKFGIDSPFLLYAGRIDESKGCDHMFSFFLRMKKEYPNDFKLVLMGKPVMEVPRHKDILPLGFVSDEDKINGMAAAKLLILPSFFESLSMSVLESMSLGVPVLVNGKCEVLKGHCIRSNGGLYYKNYHEFAECIGYLSAHEGIYGRMKENCVKYVNENYTWDKAMAKYKRLIDSTLDAIQS
jgi:glycosyltransferase involved in cell wall biosynthesis